MTQLFFRSLFVSVRRRASPAPSPFRASKLVLGRPLAASLRLPSPFRASKPVLGRPLAASLRLLAVHGDIFFFFRGGGFVFV